MHKERKRGLERWDAGEVSPEPELDLGDILSWLGKTMSEGLHLEGHCRDRAELLQKQVLRRFYTHGPEAPLSLQCGSPSVPPCLHLPTASLEPA